MLQGYGTLKNITATLLELTLLFREHEEIPNKYKFSAKCVVIERDTYYYRSSHGRILSDGCSDWEILQKEMLLDLNSVQEREFRKHHYFVQENWCEEVLKQIF